MLDGVVAVCLLTGCAPRKAPPHAATREPLPTHVIKNGERCAILWSGTGRPHIIGTSCPSENRRAIRYAEALVREYCGKLGYRLKRGYLGNGPEHYECVDPSRTIVYGQLK